jgi:UMF1 family MFS transporter
MFFATPDRAAIFVLLFLVANLNYELAQTFYNGFLPEIADDEHMGRVSALGYGLGYAGAALLLTTVLVLIRYGDALGLPDADGFRARLSLMLVGIWWASFSLPILLIVRDRSPPAVAPQSVLVAARQGLREVATTIRRIRSYRMLSMFLLGFLIFNDGVQTLFSQTSVFAEKVLQLKIDKLASVILMIQLIALPGALLVGRLADRIGQKAALNLCLAVWVAVLSGAFFISQEWHFWIMAAATALVLGGTQSVSRTIVGLMTPESRAGEFFGFFNLSGKAFGIVGPIFFSEILARTGSAHWAILGLLLFFVVGWVVIIPLDISVGQREAREESDAGH